MARPLLASFLAVAAVACGSGGTPSTTSSTSTTGHGGASTTPTSSGGAGGSAGAGGKAPVVDPSLFDCTAKKPPVRVNPIPVACATDPACATKLISGHRGAGGELGVVAPEDTVAAVRAAIVLGLDYVETDPRPTKDGVLVNVHDTTVDRTTDGTGSVDQMTLAEVQALHIVSDKTPGDFSCERIPTLEDILTAAKGKIHVLVDANKTDRVDLLVGAIQKTGTQEWAIFDTSSADKIDQALALEPELLTMIRVGTTADLAAQLDHFQAHPPVVVELDSGSDMGALVPAVHAAKNRAFTDVFVVDLAAGLSDDPTVYAQVANEGLDILQTDRPDLVLAYMGRWPPPPQP